MSFYIRKAITVGPLRFNLSKSGVGVSAGMKGFRVGSGPRGNYVHMGRQGLYYRAALAGGGGPRRELQPAPVPVDSSPDGMRAIDSASAATMTDATAGDLIAEFESKRKVARLFPLVLAVAIGAFLVVLGTHRDPLLLAAVVAAGAAACWLAFNRDELKKTVVLMYDLEDDAQATYRGLCDAFLELGKCGGVWHVASEGSVRDKKRNAGAGAVISRTPTRPTTQLPRFVKANIDVPSLHAGSQTLHFFPDRVLVFERNGSVGAVPYPDLRIQRSSTRFIERGHVPADATVVGQTWQYVNKSGGPDRRFKQNQQIPIASYETCHFTSESGLNELFHVSKMGAAAPLVAAVDSVVRAQRTATSTTA